MKVYRKGQFPLKLLADANVDLSDVELIAYGGTRANAMMWLLGMVGGLLAIFLWPVSVLAALGVAIGWIVFTTAFWFRLSGQRIALIGRHEVRVFRVEHARNTRASFDSTYPIGAARPTATPRWLSRGRLWTVELRDSSGTRLLRLTNCMLCDSTGELAEGAELDSVTS